MAHFQMYAHGTKPPVRWRLVSDNNRELGRGQVEYDDVESCRLGVKQFVYRLGEVSGGLVEAGPNRWRWQAVLDGVVVAQSSHTFDRRNRCGSARLAFLQLAPVARLRNEVLDIDTRAYRYPKRDAT